MIFKQIFGKTVEAAMKSARQIYGDDFTVFQTIEGDKKQQPGISLIADKKISENKVSRQDKKGSVYFEKSEKKDHQNGQNRRIDDELRTLRKIAESQTTESVQNKRSSKRQPKKNFQGKTAFSPVTAEELNHPSNPLHVYSRKSVRKPDALVTENSSFDTSDVKPRPDKKPGRTRSLLSRFDESKPTIKKPASNQTVFKQPNLQHSSNDEIQTLHKRFDKLEALLHSELISANLEYASHPIFQQLIQTGIPSKVVSDWFRRIIVKNIDPFDESENFALEISKILKSALINDSISKPKKNELFLGFSGSGKTSLIMKLILKREEYMQKQTAVISVLPSSKKQKNYYTILEPFCIENGIDYFKVGVDSDLSEIHQDLNRYHHLFIDTPSLPVENDEAISEYRNLQKLLAPVSGLDTHLTINMANSYLDSQLVKSHSLVAESDFIALTHMDEVEEWGPVIPLFEKTGCTCRYLSLGDSLNDSLKYFDAAWLTKKILENTD